MSRMSYEQRMFIQDSKEKKSTAQGARHTRTHCGKGGAVRLPSDYMTEKEKKAMSGECKTYRLNAPMTWQEFKDLPDDLKVDYIKALRQKYNVPDNAIAEMLGVKNNTLCMVFNKLHLNRGAGKGPRSWDKEAFYIWSGKSIVTDEDLTKDDIETMMVTDDIPEPDYTYNTLVPTNGEMLFEGNIDDILRTVSMMLCNSKVRLKIKWDVVKDNVDPETKKDIMQKGVATATYALMNAERRERLGTKG